MKILDELEALSKAATPGPWVSLDKNSILHIANSIVHDFGHEKCEEHYKRHIELRAKNNTDIKLITSSRNHIDALIRVARAAKAFANSWWNEGDSTGPIHDAYNAFYKQWEALDSGGEDD